MSLKFTIRNTDYKPEKEGDTFIRFTGNVEPFNRACERSVKIIGGTTGNPKYQFNTGLDENQVKFFTWLNDEEKKVIVDMIKELKPLIEDYYGGESTLDPSNYFFWKKERNVNRLSLTNEDIGVFFDTSKPTHALLYLSIMSGAFMDIVAPTKEWAERYQLPHYLKIELEDGIVNLDEEEDIRRSDAHAALSQLRKEHGRDALYILSWCILYETNAFGAIHSNTSEKDLVNYLIKYIDGKLVSKKKRNTPKVFIDYFEKWNGQQTRPLLYTEAYVKAGEYYSFLQQREKKYTTSDGTILGNTIQDAVSNLMKPKLTSDYEKLREQVTNKWKE